MKLVLDDQGNHLDSYTISLKSFRSFRGHLSCKPVTGQDFFFAVSFIQQTGSKLYNRVAGSVKQWWLRSQQSNYYCTILQICDQGLLGCHLKLICSTLACYPSHGGLYRRLIRSDQCVY